MSESYSNQRCGLLEGLDRARAQSEDAELKYLEQVDYECEQHKFLEAGQDHAYWKRNWAVKRLKHIQNKDERFPRPTENHVHKLIEESRPPFTNNVPEIQVVALIPGLDLQERKLNTAWRWISQVGEFESFWAGCYDYFPETGTTGGKTAWDFSAPRGGRPRFEHVDPKAIAGDPLAVINHRNCQVIRLKHRVDVGELKSLVPELKDKIQAVSSIDSARGGMSNLNTGRDTGQNALFGSSVEDRVAEVVEMWIRPETDIIPFTETELNAIDDGKPFGGEEPWIVYTFIPGAGIINREIAVNGLQIGTGQAWRNPDSIYGISSVEMIVGMQIALDQLSIRGHKHRLSMFSPPLLLPRDSGVQRKHVSGRAAPIWEPDTTALSSGIGWLNVPGPNQEALAYLANQPQVMRDILSIDKLGADVLNRQQTATAITEVRQAMEAQMQQMIKNLNNMVVDLARSAISLTLENAPLDLIFRGNGGEFDVVTPEDMAQIDLSNFAVKLATDRSGSLTKSGRMASVRQVIELNLFDPMNPLPLALKEIAIDSLEVPRGEELKKILRDQEAQKMAASEAMVAQEEEAVIQEEAEAEEPLSSEELSQVLEAA